MVCPCLLALSLTRPVPSRSDSSDPEKARNRPAQPALFVAPGQQAQPSDRQLNVLVSHESPVPAEDSALSPRGYATHILSNPGVHSAFAWQTTTQTKKHSRLSSRMLRLFSLCY